MRHKTKKGWRDKEGKEGSKEGVLKGRTVRFKKFGRPVPKMRGELNYHAKFRQEIDPFPDKPIELSSVPTKKPPPSTKTKEQTRKDLNYTLWYGTNRQPNDPQDIAEGFSGKRDKRVHHGVCKIHVPESHKMGSTGSTWWKRLITGVDDRLKLTSIEELTSAKFWKGVSSQLKDVRVGDRDAVIFVHGYNVSFEDAALRAAQLGTDLAVKGCMAFFSWPSRATKRGYPADEASIEASEPFITQFMVDFAQHSGASKIHIIAHSMGNRGVLRAVNRIASRAARRTGKPFDQIILAAPDVDADTFRDLCKAYAQVSRRTTLYVSSRDKAVEAAQWLHGFARAGLMPPIMIAPKIDTVNVTNADLTMLGHGYVAEARGVLTDIHSLLRFGAPPAKRFGLQRQKSDDNKTYWLIGE
jgi:esterase/lipase superfamily enzyme